ncbi:hypothetical protein A7P95_06745 [Eikenella longinqua]|uniref:Cofactor-independent phosphoglycerate mutase n=1 Tax=Eikenella longinqua TaxID=1795827 RepID=A0A1A9RXC0_9NEIS|nr:hypothetical protein [Eikenella longinqua]OAM27606.1 hypothetical protein A7P95_06745 [Eikenella longinqua]
MFTLCLPGLHWPHPAELPALHTPGLNQLLRFGRFQAAPSEPADFCFQHLSPQLHHLFAEPYAFASPLHQQIGLHSTQLQSSGLHILPEEAEVLCHGLNAFCHEDSWQFAPLSPELWSIRLPRPAQWQAPYILNIAGHHADIPQALGSRKSQWLQRQTEIQMWLHNHPVNTRRSAEGKPPINALWLWDELPTESPAAPPALIGSHSPWAAYSRSPQVRPAPANLAAWQATAAECRVPLEHSTLYLHELRQAAELGRPDDYARTLQQWDEQFFAPLWQALQRKQLPAARLLTDGEHGGSLEISARSGWAFWKPKHRFAGRLDISTK